MMSPLKPFRAWSHGSLTAPIAAVLLLAGALRPAAAEDAPRQPSVSDPRPAEIETADGVLLAATLYPAKSAGRDTPVVVMLADQDESPAGFTGLAMRLQQPREDDPHQPMTVLTVALRGQGDSTRVRDTSGEVVDRRGMKLKPADAAAMVKNDMEAVRRFLVDQNDDQKCNLNRLAYLGVGLGAIVATNAAALDWSMPTLSRGKQGCDVRALVLVSPPWKALGLTMLPALRQPGVQSQVAFLVTYGAEARGPKDDAERLVRQLRKSRPEPAETRSDKPADEPAEVTATTPPLIDAPAATRLQGAMLLKQAGSQGELSIARFLEQTLGEADLPWVQRRLD